jgi:hypothetical protein
MGDIERVWCKKQAEAWSGRRRPDRGRSADFSAPTVFADVDDATAERQKRLRNDPKLTGTGLSAQPRTLSLRTAGGTATGAYAALRR